MSNRLKRRALPTQICLLDDAQLLVTRVSDYSYFHEPIWRFGPTTAGKTNSILNWVRDIPEAISSHPRWRRLLLQAKRIVISLMSRATRGLNLKPDRLCSVGRCMRSLIHWMFLAGYSNLSEINEDSAADYIDFLAGQYIDDDDSSSVSTDTFATYIDVLARLYEQSPLFDRFPQIQVSSHPMKGKAATAVARQYIRSPRVRIPSVPDQIHLPCIREALHWIRDKSTDVLRLAKVEQMARDACAGWKSKNYMSYINARVIGFTFHGGGTLATPWREPIKSEVVVTVSDEAGERTSRWFASRQIRDLYESTRDASCLTLEALVGFRISEIAGLQANPRQQNGWPHCLTVRPSMDGLKEVFFIRGKVFKGTEGYQEVEWVAGIRPVGSDHFPDAVEAILLLDKLYEYWRTLAGLDDLIVSFGKMSGLPREPGTLSPIMSDVLRDSQKSFIQRFVDVEERFRFWNVTTHQWRKKFAKDVIRIDPDALPSVREHFKHLSDYVTDTAYLGSNPTLLKIVDNERLRMASRDFLDIMLGQRSFTGKMARIIQRELAELKTVCETLETEGEKLAAVEESLKAHDVRAWRCEYGTCLFRSDTSLCHFIAKGTHDRTARRPLAQERCPDVCCTCSNLVISEVHISFWKARYREHKELLDASIAAAEAAIAGIARQRMSRAMAILRKLGLKTGEFA